MWGFYLSQVLSSFLDLQLLADLTADLLLDFVQLLLDHSVGQVQVVSQTQPLCHQLAPGIPLREESTGRGSRGEDRKNIISGGKQGKRRRGHRDE